VAPSILRKLATFVVPVFGVAAAAALANGCSTSNDNKACPADGTTTKTRQALGSAPIFGASLAAKQLALTFDDGPGSRTLELSAYLKAQGIKAGFFVNGQCFEGGGCGNGQPASVVLAQLVADGHVVANHTHRHYDLTNTTQFPATPAGDTAIINELSLTDAIIAPYVAHKRFMFRAPFGAFDARAYNVLHASPMDKYVGHIEWDIGGQRTATTGADFACWQNDPKLTSKGCGDLYIMETNYQGKGIVLMHDADLGNVGNTNPTSGTGNTIDMVKYMVPLLKVAGYTFVRVDEVPAINALLPPIPPTPDGGTDGGGSSSGGTDASTPNTPQPDAAAPGANPCP
jgi:peptidoglycan/xylan/chitin deacetylase (PgdA/CDA1 family)